MILSIPPSAKVFRRAGGAWHILAKVSDNGFDPKSHPTLSRLWGTVTHISLCGIARYSDTDTAKEFSTVGEIRKICPSCWPYSKLEKEPK